MARIAVVTDSVSNIPPDVAAQHRITVVPIYLTWDGRSYRDGVDITPEEVYRRLRLSATLPRTAAPSAGDFVQTYLQLAREAEHIVSVHIAKELSGTVGAAQIAAEMVKDVVPVHVVDSGTAAMASGFVALAAARAVADGADVKRAIAAAEAVRDKVQLLVALDTLSYLQRAGRIGRAASLVGNAVQIKPIVTIREHVVDVAGKPRTMARALRMIMDGMHRAAQGRPLHVAVMHAGTPEAADAFRRQIEAEFTCAELLTTDFTPVMGVSAGPGLLGTAFYPDE